MELRSPGRARHRRRVRADDALTADIEAVCQERLAEYRIPREIHFVEELPKISTRKIDKVDLRDRFV